MAEREDEWSAYYENFPYFSADRVRDDCHPRIREHAAADNAVVLVHGLSDSPYFMTAIAKHFHEQLGYNVYLPLLHFHGLKEPKGMEGVEVEEWKRNVAWAIRCATQKADRVSVGGLSTGGALAFYAAATSPKVTGDLFLFSAALDLIIDRSGLIGDIAERVLRSDALTWILDLADRDRSLIGENPYRYAYVDKDGARELSGLIKETDGLLDGFDARHPFPKRVFAAHSHADRTANIDGVLDLEKVTSSGSFTGFFIDEAKAVAHASLVLAEDIVVGGKVLEQRNSEFAPMMGALTAFVRAG
ncbi:MAG: alpha/beta fold hydrolase [Pseudomonadota bacterium]